MQDELETRNIHLNSWKTATVPKQQQLLGACNGDLVSMQRKLPTTLTKGIQDL